MVLSCGIDIEEINRFDKHYFQNGILSDLIYDIFTTREIENYSYYGKKAFLKGFCFKEAFYKAINSLNISWCDIEILFTENDYKIEPSALITIEIAKKGIKKIDINFRETDQYIICTVLLLN
ncbi:MAG: 4'-phosphopantetheinyl transferase superfamily protein [Bacteroidales bacterium]